MEIDTICMSGGGLKGFSFVGALDYLNNTNYLDIKKIIKFVGTSAGSILALMLTIGYTPVELGDFVIDFDFKKMDPDILVENVFLKFGISNGERFEFILKSFLKRKLGVDDINFKNLYQVTKKTLVIIGTNFTKCCEEVFSWENTPSMSVITAVRISCSIPVFFTPVLYKGCYYVDGGVKNNFPINYCNKKTTLGLYIKNNNLIDSIDSIATIVTGCLGIVTDTITFKDTDFHENVIQIDNYANEAIKFDLTIENKLKIINLGQTYAKKFVEEYPKKICTGILNEIINNIEIEINKKKFQDAFTQTDFLENTIKVTESEKKST
jgi:predicted acylesterase/phospholipase RssA